MDIKNLKFAYTKYGICDIINAKKDFNYFLDKELKIELTYCCGEKVKPYWRKKKNVDIQDLIGYFNGESLSHYNEKMNIFYSKKFKINDTIFVGEYSEFEYNCKQPNKFIDVVLLDKNRDVIVGIEIFNTNKKKHNDIKSFYNLNFPIYEYDINKKTINLLHDGDCSKKTKKTRSRIEKGYKCIHKINERIEMLKKGIERIHKRHNKKWRDYYKFKEEFEFKIAKEYECEIINKETEIDLFRERIQDINQRIRVVKSGIAKENRKLIK